MTLMRRKSCTAGAPKGTAMIMNSPRHGLNSGLPPPSTAVTSANNRCEIFGMSAKIASGIFVHAAIRFTTSSIDYGWR
ncbi:hypothetical protein LA080_007029 [Diaporthe eres]|nr:hypothetical protein LA080_007029 [Diaporthe eres]